MDVSKVAQRGLSPKNQGDLWFLCNLAFGHVPKNERFKNKIEPREIEVYFDYWGSNGYCSTKAIMEERLQCPGKAGPRDSLFLTSIFTAKSLHWDSWQHLGNVTCAGREPHFPWSQVAVHTLSSPSPGSAWLPLALSVLTPGAANSTDTW